MSTICTDIIQDILLRLPVKTLLCFRCVSKSFCTLIDSPEFIKSHLNASVQNKNRKKLILASQNGSRCGLTTTYNYYAIGFNGGVEEAAVVRRKQMHLTRCESRLIGSCNGLILLMESYETMLLWNPFTCRYCSLFTYNAMYHDAFGFGYDAASNEYKVVMIIYRNRKAKVWVYSLKSNSWRILTDFPYKVSEFDKLSEFDKIERRGKLVNGALHWLYSKHTNWGDITWESIVAFDISTEKFHTLQVPDHLMGNTYSRLHVLEDQLYFSSTRYVNSNQEVEIYVGEKHGAMLINWSKLGLFPCSSKGIHFGFLKPLCDLNEADKVQLNTEICCDCSHICNCNSDNSITCCESLVSIA